MLQELTFESALRIGECSLRIGLAATAWQLNQAHALLVCAGIVPKLPAPAGLSPAEADHVVAVALDTGLGRRPTALATVSLRRDGGNGLSLDARHGSALATLRAQGARLAEIDQLAFDRQLPVPSMIAPMARALSSVAVDAWGSTGVVFACGRDEAVFYCDNLGFSPVKVGARGKRDDEVLLHLPTSRLGHLLAPVLGSAQLPAEA